MVAGGPLVHCWKHLEVISSLQKKGRGGGGGGGGRGKRDKNELYKDSTSGRLHSVM